jgi:hypothetical protein
MKTYRVTIVHKSSNHNSVVSITVPAVSEALAIDTTTRSHNLAGKVVSARAVEIN